MGVLFVKQGELCQEGEGYPHPLPRAAKDGAPGTIRLLVFEGFDGVEAGGAVGGQGAEDDADDDRGGEGDGGGPGVYGDLEWGEEGDGEGEGEAEGSADDAAREREEDGLGKKLEADFLAGGSESLADTNLADAGLDVGEHGVHDADAGDDEGDSGGEGEDDGEHVGDLCHAGEEFREGDGVVDRSGAVAGADDLEDAAGGGDDHGGVLHGEEDLFDGVGPCEVAGDGVGNQKGLLADLGLAVGVEALLEDSDDGDGDPQNADRLAHGVVGRAEEGLGEGLDDDGDLLVGEGVLVVEEASGEHAEVADDAVLGGDAEDHSVLGDTSPDRDAVVVLQHGGGGDDAGHLFEDRVEVFAGHEVGGAGVVRANGAAAAVLELDLVGADAGELVERELLAGEAEGGDEDDGGRADDHAEHGEHKADLAGLEAVDGEVKNLGEVHGGACGGEGAVEGAGGALGGCDEYRASCALNRQNCLSYSARLRRIDLGPGDEMRLLIYWRGKMYITGNEGYMSTDRVTCCGPSLGSCKGASSDCREA